MTAWASLASRLQDGETVTFRAYGQSMMPRVKPGQLCTVAPLQGAPAVGDVVLCRVKGNYYLHLVKAVDGQRVLIGNNKGHDNGWTTTVYGKLNEG